MSRARQGSPQLVIVNGFVGASTNAKSCPHLLMLDSPAEALDDQPKCETKAGSWSCVG
jgi:hypothetical protein